MVEPMRNSGERGVEVFRPKTLDEALQIRENRRAVPLAGGTDLLVRLKGPAGGHPRLEGAVMVIDHLNELKEIRWEGNLVKLGAGVTLSELAWEDAVPLLLREAAAGMAAPGVRNRGTLGGNLVNASPAGDTIPPLLCLDAQVVLRSLAGERRLPLADFVTGPGQTCLADQELLTAVELTAEPPSWYFYRKVGTRRANALSKLSVAGALWLEAGRIVRFAAAVGAVGPRVAVPPGITELTRGMRPADLRSQRREILDAFDPLVTPIDDQRSTAAYRRKVAFNLLEDLLVKAENSGNEGGRG